MQKELENYLSLALKRLEQAYREILKTQGYSQEAERMQLLKELIKEQVKNENTHHTTR